MLASVLGLLLCAAGVSAFEVEATLKKVDPDRGVIVFFARGQDRTARVATDAKILDIKGNKLADGLRARDLKAGAEAVLSIEREGDRPVIHAIRLGKPSARPVPAESPTPDTSGLTPLTDLKGTYQGFAGGLYPGGNNERPAAHEAAGLALAKHVKPLDADGKPSADGKIVLLGVGFSNTVQAFTGFQRVAAEDRDLNPLVVLVNGAVGGLAAHMIQHPDDNGRGAKYWATVDERLRAAGVTRAQVEVIWLKETDPAPHEGGFPKYIQALQGELANIVRILPGRFPNVKLVYLSSRTYGGWARGRDGRGPGNSEPYSYETAFAVQGLIAQQLRGDPALNFEPTRGEVKAPWLSWGSYLWANGTARRGDGFHFDPADYRADDRMHHSEAGMRKMGQQLLAFFKSDPTTRGWFTRAGLAAQPPAAKGATAKDPQSTFEPRSSPGAGQKFLEKFVGQWDVVKTFYPRSGTPFRVAGECRQTMIHGGRFLQSDFVFGQAGNKTTGLGLIGFETETGKFTSVWTDSRATRMSLRQSEEAFNGREIVLYGKSLSGPAKGPTRSRTVTRLEDNGRRIVHRQFAVDAQGNERPVMELAMTRKAEK
jgi:hypothetical protein